MLGLNTGNRVINVVLRLAGCLFVLYPFFVRSQSADTLFFSLKMEDHPMFLHKEYQSGSDTFRLETVRFYLSNIQLRYNGKTISKADGRIFLIDAEDSASMKILVPVAKQAAFDEIVLSLGIDSTVNVAGVQGGVLDPVSGMYWSWQSGYINAKIEGWSPKSTARKQEFNYHLGGYLAPNDAHRTIRLKADKPATACTIEVQLMDFLRQTDVVNKPMVMSPGASAMQLSDTWSNCFYLKP